MKQKKLAIVQNLGEKLSSLSQFILIGFEKTSHQTLENLRKALRDSGAQVKVVKNTLFEKTIHKEASKNPTLNKLKSEFPLKNNSALIFLSGAWDQGLKAVANFIKKEESINFKFGLLDGVLYKNHELKTLATLPGRTEFMGKFAYLFKSPISRSVFASKFPIMMLVNVLKEKAKKG